MSTPWEGKLRVEREDDEPFASIYDDLGLVADSLTEEEAHALVHRANAYEGLVEAVGEIVDILAEYDDEPWGFESVPGDVAGRVYNIAARARDARRTLDSMEDSDDLD